MSTAAAPARSGAVLADLLPAARHRYAVDTALVVGGLARRGGDRSVLRTAGTMAVGSLVIYAVGVPYLALSTGMSMSAAVAAGLVPFLIGDALKAALAMGALPASWKLAGRRG